MRMTPFLLFNNPIQQQHSNNQAVMSEQQFEINDQRLMDRLQEIVPELKKELETTIRNKFEMNIEKLQEDKRRELSRKYETLIKQRVEESNSTIKNSLTSLVQMIDNYKITQKGKAKQMTKEEEQQFIQQTVEEILADDNMIEEVKNRLRPKLEARVRAALEKELEDGVELGKRQLTHKLKQERQAWTEERIMFWREQSNRELEELATQHNDLNSKKQSIQSALTHKKAEKMQLQQRLSLIMQKNGMVSNLRRELKQLKERMRA